MTGFRSVGGHSGLVCWTTDTIGRLEACGGDRAIPELTISRLIRRSLPRMSAHCPLIHATFVLQVR